MKKIIGIILAIVLAFILGGVVVHFFTNRQNDGNTRVTNDKAEKEESRYLTIINETEKTINEVHICVGDGTEIEKAYQKNPDEKSFSVEIPKEYEEYEDFKITLVDNYDRIYEKMIKNVKKSGRTEVLINADDYIEQAGDWKTKIYEFFNN